MTDEKKHIQTVSESDHEFEALLDYLKRSRSFDFTGYKRSSLMRRVEKRMQGIDIESYADYIDFLEVYPEEFSHLFNTILINVTSFFRDPQSWEYLTEKVIPRLIAGKAAGEPIRAWSAGCASGEEAYTLAIILAEALGMEQFRERVKIYATDIDEEALSKARQAVYTARDVSGAPLSLVEKYFDSHGGSYTVNKDLRRAVIFGRHDLIQDAPISRIDLLICRNALMYFNTEIQAKILARLHFALNDNGCMFLGKAEMLFTHSNLFMPLDLKRRIFVKVPKINLRDRLLLMSKPGSGNGSDYDRQLAVAQASMHEHIFDMGPLAQVVVDINGTVAQVNDRARSQFRLTKRDIGRPLQDLEISYRPVELRSCLEKAYSERRPINVKDAPWASDNGGVQYLDVQIVPVQENDGHLIGACITYIDVTRYKELQDELQEANRELETAYEELQSTVEELETTNEELQSTVEELETTNEELQSTNEELETINEELQSTNEELQTMNEELRQRSAELNDVNGFLESILTSLRGGVVVLNPDLQIQIWNREAAEFWGLRNEEVLNKHFLNLDIGLPVDQLKQPIRECLAGVSNSYDTILAARNRRGKTIQCRVTCTPLITPKQEIRGVILLMEDCTEQSEK